MPQSLVLKSWNKATETLEDQWTQSISGALKMMRRSRYNPPDYMLFLTDADEVVVIYKDGTKKFMVTLPSTPKDIAVRNDGAFCYIGADEKLRVYDNTGTLKKFLDSTTTPAIYVKNSGCAFAGNKIWVVQENTAPTLTPKLRRYDFADLANPTQDWECTMTSAYSMRWYCHPQATYYMHRIWLTPDGTEALVALTPSDTRDYELIQKISSGGVATQLYYTITAGQDIVSRHMYATIDNLILVFCGYNKVVWLKNDGTKREFTGYDKDDTISTNFDGSIIVMNHDTTVSVYKSTNPPALDHVKDEEFTITGTSVPIQLTDDGKYLFIVDVTTMKVRDIDAKVQKYTYNTIFTKHHEVLREYSV